MKQMMGRSEVSWLDEIVENFLPEESQIQGTPLKSAASQRLQLKKDLKNLFVMHELDVLLSAGMKSIYLYMETHLSPQKRGQFLADLDRFMQNFKNQIKVNDQAIDLCQLCGLTQEVVHTMEESGEYHFQYEDFAHATGVYTVLTLLQPYEPRHWLRLGLSLQGQHKFDQAIICFQAAAELADEDPGPLLLQASCLLQKGDQIKAVELHKNAQNLLNPTSMYYQTWGPYMARLQNRLNSTRG